MEYLLGYGAGLLTLINPCVLPVLPIVLASALQTQKHGPLALAAGMSLTFVLLGVGIATLGSSIGLDADRVSQIGAWLMLAFGLVLLVPRLNAGFSLATAGVASGADAKVGRLDMSNLSGQFLGGTLLGVVWSPCVGPTLGGAIALAYQGESLLKATGIMASFAMGISTIILLLGYGAGNAIRKRRDLMRKIADKSKPIMGIIFVLVALLILTHTSNRIEGWILNAMPAWLQDLTVAI